MIRKLTDADRELYIEMAHEFYHSDAVLHPVPDEYFVRTADEALRSGDYAGIYLLEYEGKPAGYALTAKTFSQEAGGFVIWIEEIYIREAYRSRGLGKEFFRYLDENKGSDVTRLRLEVEADNRKAASLYERLGYEVLDYVQMVKDSRDPSGTGAR
ncbi:GNAT family N-acetyltransferase [Ruminococcus sp. CLA-AA-H200]|uniref:GNAT family N-acetyltransferase n=1 Tax=Ruminococcus turbiniformis TaxID=2881258 RepID=A0ABS8FVF6_9FIRM|nr:GNAT family N-acetyltransferase [Ruminococcus turbiniformis]MCC2254025.1 GNAT family N-acetyltransferase [Ruminococcus turbiniformis]